MKTHYELLDGLRGIAALMVIIYHVYECFPVDTWLIGHGYLAVDAFFVLSGFVIGYAYDDRWERPSANNLTLRRFFFRRLIRLHPMVVFSVVCGLVCFIVAGGTNWEGSKISTTALMLATLMGLFIIPQMPHAASDVRGNGEMYPLNGPHWSLFFEYIGNIMYALFIRRFSTKVLTVWTSLLGILFAWFFVSDFSHYGNIGVGWTLDGLNFYGGLLRMSFSYSLGLLLSRIHTQRKSQTKGLLLGQSHALQNYQTEILFVVFAFIFIAILSVPPIDLQMAAPFNFLSVNCIYEVFCVVFVIPAIVYFAASTPTADHRLSRFCTLLGDISYPLYAVHYPSMYIFYAYIGFPDTWRTPHDCYSLMIVLVVGNILFAYLVLRLYDNPIRRYLTNMFS